MGSGAISLHSDDIYESLDIDFLSLSVCRDITFTPTTFLHTNDIVSNLTDKEFLSMFNTKARFISGKNVKGNKTQIKPLAFYKQGIGVGFNLDFRIDRNVGANAYANALGIFESIATTLFVYFPHLYNFSLCRVIKRAIIFLSRLYWR